MLISKINSKVYHNICISIREIYLIINRIITLRIKIVILTNWTNKDILESSLNLKEMKEWIF